MMTLYLALFHPPHLINTSSSPLHLRQISCLIALHHHHSTSAIRNGFIVDYQHLLYSNTLTYIPDMLAFLTNCLRKHFSYQIINYWPGFFFKHMMVKKNGSVVLEQNDVSKNGILFWLQIRYILLSCFRSINARRKHSKKHVHMEKIVFMKKYPYWSTI